MRGRRAVAHNLRFQEPLLLTRKIFRSPFCLMYSFGRKSFKLHKGKESLPQRRAFRGLTSPSCPALEPRGLRGQRTHRDLAPRYRQADSLQKSSLVLLLIVRTKLDLTLIPGKLAGLVEGDRVGAVQDVVSGLETDEQHQQGPSGSLLAVPPWKCRASLSGLLLPTQTSQNRPMPQEAPGRRGG